jgi:hypothetical protein
MQREKIEEFVFRDLSGFQRSSELRLWLAAAVMGLEPIFHGSGGSKAYDGSRNERFVSTRLIDGFHGEEKIDRGDKSTGDMQREKIEEFVFLDLSSFQRSSEFLPWLAAAVMGLEPIFHGS